MGGKGRHCSSLCRSCQCDRGLNNHAGPTALSASPSRPAPHKTRTDTPRAPGTRGSREGKWRGQGAVTLLLRSVRDIALACAPVACRFGPPPQPRPTPSPTARPSIAPSTRAPTTSAPTFGTRARPCTAAATALPVAVPHHVVPLTRVAQHCEARTRFCRKQDLVHRAWRLLECRPAHPSHSVPLRLSVGRHSSRSRTRLALLQL